MGDDLWNMILDTTNLIRYVGLNINVGNQIWGFAETFEDNVATCRIAIGVKSPFCFTYPTHILVKYPHIPIG